MYEGQKVKYLKNGILKISEISAWSNHSTFTEIFLTNGDIICEDEVTDYPE